MLLDPERQAERIHALCDAAQGAGVALVVNARVDVYLRQSGTGTLEHHERTEEAIRRSRAYLDAGATCVYPIGLTDQDEIAHLVEALAAPVNIWLRADTPSLAALARMGVARVSLAAGLQRAAMSHVTALTNALRAGEDAGLFADRQTAR